MRVVGNKPKAVRVVGVVPTIPLWGGLLFLCYFRDGMLNVLLEDAVGNRFKLLKDFRVLGVIAKQGKLLRRKCRATLQDCSLPPARRWRPHGDYQPL